MKNIRTVLLAIFLVLPALSFAQRNTYEDELLTNEQRSRERYILNNAAQTNVAGPVSNAVLVDQEGSRNRAETMQQHTSGNSRNPNVIAVIQSGNLNTATLEQQGEGNQGYVNQRGSGNDYEGRINGDNNSTYAEQNGRNNRIKQDLAGNDMEYRLIQRGNNNQINQYENGTQNKGYEVIQQGSGMNITITNGF